MSCILHEEEQGRDGSVEGVSQRVVKQIQYFRDPWPAIVIRFLLLPRHIRLYFPGGPGPLYSYLIRKAEPGGPRTPQLSSVLVEGSVLEETQIDHAILKENYSDARWSTNLKFYTQILAKGHPMFKLYAVDRNEQCWFLTPLERPHGWLSQSLLHVLDASL